MTYSINDKESFSNIEVWMKQIRQQASSTIAKILVGNKCDMDAERQVTFEEGKQLADIFGIRFFETSAKADINVNDAFMSICKEIKEKFSNAPENQEGIHLRANNTGNGQRTPQKTCC